MISPNPTLVPGGFAQIATMHDCARDECRVG
jgi:hypothetical protein